MNHHFWKRYFRKSICADPTKQLCFQIIHKCPNLESLDILDINISITYHGVRERSMMFYDAAYNDCIDRCIKAAQFRDNLRFLRYLDLFYV